MNIDELQALPWADTLAEVAAPQVFLVWLDAKLDAVLEEAARIYYHPGVKHSEVVRTLSGQIHAITIEGKITI